MAKLSIRDGHPVRLTFPGKIGMASFRSVSALVLQRVRQLVHFEIGIFDGKTLAFVTVQPTTEYSTEDAMRELRAIAQDLNADGPELAQPAAG